MSYRSWLRDAKTVFDIGHYVIDESDPSAYDRETEHLARRFERQAINPPVRPEFAALFNGAMHDSPVFGFARSGNQVTLRVNSDYAIEFALALSGLVGKPEPVTPFEVRFVAKDVAYCRTARHKPDGRLQWASILELPFGIDRHALSFGSDHFFLESDRIQWIVKLHAHHWPRRPILSTDFYLVVDCAEIEVVDLQRIQIAEQFGAPWAEIWDDLMDKNRESGMPSNWRWESGLREYLSAAAEQKGLAVG